MNVFTRSCSYESTTTRLLEMFIKNIAIEQKEREQIEEETEAEACIKCDNCKSCC